LQSFSPEYGLKKKASLRLQTVQMTAPIERSHQLKLFLTNY